MNCPVCAESVQVTKAGRIRKHPTGADSPCPASGQGAIPLPEAAPCTDSKSPTTNPKSSDAPQTATSATDMTASALGIIRATHISPTTAPQPTPPNSPPNGPTSAYERPDKLNRAVTGIKPMSEFDAQLVARFKEIFYQYTNRTRRSTQKTLGPSEIGTPCDRRLVMHLMGMPHVNPGGDNWASFRGTCVHAGLAEMMDWADAGQGRFATEMALTFPSPVVPHGTLDLVDRVLFMVDDHKVMGQWSLDQLKTQGIPGHYRVQLHVYGMGARIRGEQVERVALLGWPADKPNLDDMWAISEPYDPAIARKALDRVERLQARVNEAKTQGLQTLAESADIADDCKYCPFHLKGAANLDNGACNGRT